MAQIDPNRVPFNPLKRLERVRRIELPSEAWEAHFSALIVKDFFHYAFRFSVLVFRCFSRKCSGFRVSWTNLDTGFASNRRPGERRVPGRKRRLSGSRHFSSYRAAIPLISIKCRLSPSFGVFQRMLVRSFSSPPSSGNAACHRNAGSPPTLSSDGMIVRSNSISRATIETV